MGEFQSPNPTTKQRAPIASRIHSPTSPFFLGSNDDKLERAQARAARAAAIRRKPVATDDQYAHMDADPCLGKQQILELFQNCIKLASENKINQKNTWELNLIDHLCEIIKVEEEEDVETNFQKASCTLEAGVKIYSMRVDSVHSEAYKVLGGINRAGQENGPDSVGDNANMNIEQEELHSKKEQDKKLSPLSTLEPSFETLNVKKFDAAFAVDPLYHQTSAQFDEGGAKGLLLNNLGVYGGCQVLFDSLEIPGKCTSSAIQSDISDTVDISFAKDYVDLMVSNMRVKNEISPTLSDIVNQFDEDNRRPLDTFSSVKRSEEQVDAANNNEAELDIDVFDNSDNWALDHDDQTTVFDEDSNGAADPSFQSYHEENEPSTFNDPESNDRFEKVDGYVFLGLGLNSKQNAWAGPDHWKYRRAKDSEDDPATTNGSPITTKRGKNKKKPEPDIDFTKALEMVKEMSDIFAPPKNPKSLLMPANRGPSNTKLPEDCHYQPEDLVKLFLLPNIMCLGKRARRSSDESRQQDDDLGPLPSWDDEGAFGGQFDEGNVQSDEEDSNTLVSQPRVVNKIEVQYDRTSKQVDVQALKETLWSLLQEAPLMPIQGQEEDTLSFSHILRNFSNDNRAAPTIRDISPHLCFICLLHLANEHGLTIRGCPNMDDLSIRLPQVK